MRHFPYHETLQHEFKSDLRQPGLPQYVDLPGVEKINRLIFIADFGLHGF